MLLAEPFAALLGVSAEAVDTRRQNAELLGLPDSAGVFHYPRWQIHDDGATLPSLPALFDRLGGGPCIGF